MNFTAIIRNKAILFSFGVLLVLMPVVQNVLGLTWVTGRVLQLAVAAGYSLAVIGTTLWVAGR